MSNSERARRITQIVELLHSMAPHMTADQVDQIDEATRLLGLLDDNTPMTDRVEVGVEELLRRGAHPTRRMLNGPLDIIRAVFHGSEVLRAGEQWTIFMGTDCGYSLDVSIHIRSEGDCTTADPNVYLKGRQPTDTPAPNDTVPALDKDWDAWLQELGLRIPVPPKKPRRSRKKKESEG